MKLILKVLLVLILVCLLTAITQVGGIVFLLSMLSFVAIDKHMRTPWKRISVKALLVFACYLFCVLLVVPAIARRFGRVPLPIMQDRNVRPGNIWTCLLNRHYVRPQLREVVFEAAGSMNKLHPGTVVNYLDGNFPFIDGFPLLPHLSHNDGKKLDLSFQYNNSKTNQATSELPSFTGYGICEEPRTGEEDMPSLCAQKGYWQYSFLRDVTSQDSKRKYTFASDRTRDLVKMLAAQDDLGKIFIEPHLRARLRLTTNKIRFHGCQAVRHDDHIHIQLK